MGSDPPLIYRPSGQQALACVSDHESCGEAEIITPGLGETEWIWEMRGGGGGKVFKTWERRDGFFFASLFLKKRC